jgi:glucose-6-phosphate 1-dehydrogenase
VIDNLLVMRFANRLLTPIWNRDNIANVQIIHKEPFGAISDYFDAHGIIRDVLQNHLLQILAVLAMDRPVSLDPEDIRDAKLKVLRQVDRVDVERKVVAGQYVAHEGKLGYKDNPNVAADSRAPTFAMLVLNIRNERWDGVPFILKAGKALNEKRSEIRIQLRQTPGDIFGDLEKPGDPTDPAVANGYAGPNEFVLRLQPHEEMYMKLTIKEPGLGVQPVPSEMELSGRWRAEQLRKEAAGEAPRRAYERLLLDAVHGHQAHFVRGDELEAAWQIVDPVNDAIESGRVPLHEYPFGTRGAVGGGCTSESVRSRRLRGAARRGTPEQRGRLGFVRFLAKVRVDSRRGRVGQGGGHGAGVDAPDETGLMRDCIWCCKLYNSFAEDSSRPVH